MKMLLVLGDRPPPGMPEIPTTGQLGYSGVRSFAWFALLAPLNTSRQIVDKISADVALFVQSADTKQREAAGQIVARYAAPAETRRVVEADYNAWASIAKAVNYKPD
jgi:tripartite-type tricarboxylate transporter receptor subunit TctC